MASPNDVRGAYRCTIAAEESAARLKVGVRNHRVRVIDTSRLGFTIRVPDALAKKIREGVGYEVQFRGETWRIEKRSEFNTGDGAVQIGFERLADLTRIKTPRSRWLIRGPHFSLQNDPVMLLYLILAFLFACIALPGVGDSLGTAPKVRKGIETVIGVVKDTIQ